MPVPTLDFELFSSAGFVFNEPTDRKPYGYWTAPPGADKPGLSAVGSHVYSQHPSTEVLTASYDLCDGRGGRRWRPGQPLPLDLFAHIQRPGATLESHKAMFEFEMWNNVCVPKYGWPPLPPHVQRCSMATANVDQYPGALANLGAVLGLSKQKDPEGDRLIKRLCVPQQPTKKDPRLRVPPPTEERLAEAVAYIDANGLTSGRQAAGLPQELHDAIEFEFLYRYCDRDVETETEAADRMAPMTDAELGYWLIDQEVNARGLGIDRPGLRACIVILEQVLEKYGEECRALTGLNVTQLEKLKGWLAAYGLVTPSLDANAIEAALKRDDLHPSAKRVLELRALTGSASVKKTFAIENQCSDDDRLRNLIVHHGARTGRPTGEGPQPLNLPKAGPQLVICPSCDKPHVPTAIPCPWCGVVPGPAERKAAWKPEFVDDVLEIMACGSLAMVERFFGDAMLCISGCLRGLFVAGPGNELIASDYTAIEAVVIAQLAGETWRNEAFERKDPIYLVGASKITGTSVDEYVAYAARHGYHHPDRQLGKISELSLSFGGWIGAWRRMEAKEGTPPDRYTDEQIKQNILAWREASPAVVELWGGQWRGLPWDTTNGYAELFGYEGCFIAAIRSPGTVYEYRGVKFQLVENDGYGRRLLLTLLSGRQLTYHDPILRPSTRPYAAPGQVEISFMTWNTNPQYGPRGWIRMETYGPKIAENVTQATAHDIQRHGIILLRLHGYPLVLGVYDECVVEVPLGYGSVDEVEALMGTMPWWARGWAVRASGGWRGRRYRKG